MRTIKFRGQKISTNKWVFGSLICDKEGNPFAICQQMDNAIDNGVLNGWVFGVIPETVGQFTGLTDKNGKEIYEGDIVKLTPTSEYSKGYEDMVGIKKVVFHKTSATFQYESFIPLNWGGFESVEIIGNIHENPELF